MISILLVAVLAGSGFHVLASSPLLPARVCLLPCIDQSMLHAAASSLARKCSSLHSVLVSSSHSFARSRVVRSQRRVTPRSTRAPAASAASAIIAQNNKMKPFNDPSSQSNYPEAKVTHVDFDVDVDFEAKEIAGTVNLSVTVGDDGPASTLVLDTRELKIEKCTVDGEKDVF